MTAIGSGTAFAALSEQHFERSKLVVLGLANKDARKAGGDDWAYERGLASNLLNDTRLYRLAAEERGMKTLAGVMGDLEIVLLQTSLADAPDRAALGADSAPDPQARSGHEDGERVMASGFRLQGSKMTSIRHGANESYSRRSWRWLSHAPRGAWARGAGIEAARRARRTSSPTSSGRARSTSCAWRWPMRRSRGATRRCTGWRTA